MGQEEPVVVQEEVLKVAAVRMEAEAQVAALEDLLQSNLLKQQEELQRRLQQADVEADRWASRPGQSLDK